MTDYDYTVAQDGSGDFRTIQEAVDAITSWRYTLHLWGRKLPLPQWFLRPLAEILKRPRFYIKEGAYTEQVVLSEDSNVKFEGCTFSNGVDTGRN